MRGAAGGRGGVVGAVTVTLRETVTVCLGQGLVQPAIMASTVSSTEATGTKNSV